MARTDGMSSPSQAKTTAAKLTRRLDKFRLFMNEQLLSGVEARAKISSGGGWETLIVAIQTREKPKCCLGAYFPSR
jgi:hypothetical protein